MAKTQTVVFSVVAQINPETGEMTTSHTCTVDGQAVPHTQVGLVCTGDVTASFLSNANTPVEMIRLAGQMTRTGLVVQENLFISALTPAEGEQPDSPAPSETPITPAA